MSVENPSDILAKSGNSFNNYPCQTTGIIVHYDKMELSFTGNHTSIESADTDALDRLLQDPTVQECLLFDSSTIYRSERVQYSLQYTTDSGFYFLEDSVVSGHSETFETFFAMIEPIKIPTLKR